MTKPPLYDDAPLDSLDPKEFIIIKRARVHNLKNLSVAIPRNQLVVITGLSGSGKSSLAFNTLFAEGQRMYVESLSAYARQFLGRMEKPDVDYIRGVAPAIAIEQKVNTRNVRSTVGTATEIYDYLKLLFARIGKTYSPKSNHIVKKNTVEDVINQISQLDEGTPIMISCRVKSEDEKDELSLLLSKGFARVLLQKKVVLIEDMTEEEKANKKNSPIEVLIDRASVKPHDKRFISRFADSIETAFFEGDGECFLYIEGKKPLRFSDRFELDGLSFMEPSTHLFSFNSPYGACKMCKGSGKTMAFSEDLVVPDKTLSVYEGAIAPWRGKSGEKWLSPLLSMGAAINFPIHRAYAALTPAERDLLWNGNEVFKGVHSFFDHLGKQLHKIQNRVMISRYREKSTCPQCQGTRLREDAGYVKIDDTSIIDLVLMPLSSVRDFFENITLNKHDQKIAQRIIKEIRTRIDCTIKMGLEYLTLNRLTATLSGGEFQRIKLTTALGSSLVGSMYIMDEPSIGLHPKDIGRMTGVLKSLRDLGNTVIIVEHEEEIMKAADQIIDIGPDAGPHGGQLVFQGTPQELEKQGHSHTADYLTGREKIAIPQQRRGWKKSIMLVGAKAHNLKDLSVEFPLQLLTVITGVSGSGKSTLIKNTLAPALRQAIGEGSPTPGEYSALDGDIDAISQVEFVDQNPIGKSSRSNPISYVKAYDAIRELFAGQLLSKQRAYKASHFSFNVEGGRCEECHGDGEIKIEMQFMADIFLPCEGCQGQRFKQTVLEVTYQEKNIADVLDMTIEEALSFFEKNKAIHTRIAPLFEVGLGYVKLGQSSSSLSGGEAQRVKLASFLGKKNAHQKGHILFIFDEPTTGLHFHDISKLLTSFNALVEDGHSVIVIEHNIEIIKCADWIIDLGPEGGEEKGGQLLFAGTPEDMVNKGTSYTAQFLKKKVP